jgi:hypothetical protein
MALRIRIVLLLVLSSSLLVHLAHAFSTHIAPQGSRKQCLEHKHQGSLVFGFTHPSTTRIPCQRSPLAATTFLLASSTLDVNGLFQDEVATKDPYDIATSLLEILVQRRKDEVDTSFEAWIRRLTKSYKLERQRQAKTIELLMEELQQYGQSKERKGVFDKAASRPAHTYDVTESLLNGFFCTLYWYMPNVADPSTAPKPIWEQVSLKDSNIKGQQYYERNDFEEAVVNYSEIWGKSVFLTAGGTLAPIDGTIVPKVQADQGSPPPRNALKRIVPNSRTLRMCPDVFRVDATKVTLHLFGMKFDLPIRGSSNLVILYADPRIRIFVSPMESKTAVGNWEEAGLVVAQVRSDLVLGQEPVMDLR